MKGCKVYHRRDKSLTGTVVAVTKPHEEDQYVRWYRQGRWHKRKTVSAGKRLVMIEWDRPCHFYKWISEEVVVVIEPVKQTKKQAKEPTNKGENAMTQVKQTCPRCNGTGLYLPKEGAKCFKCNGQKVVMYNKMTDRQIVKIRSLFKQVREAMPIDEQESLITEMNEHKDGINVRSTVWASDIIEKLIEIQTTQMGR